MKGIYSITNKLNDKIYVGSSVDIKNRWRQHKHSLRKGSHPNKHLQSSWDKYGEASFEFSVLEECTDLDKSELKWIDFYNANNREKGYNKRLDGSTNRGIKRTPEQIEAMRQRALGVKQSKETIEKRKATILLNKQNGFKRKTGWKLSEETLKARKERGRTRVFQYTIDGKLVAEYHAINKAAEETGYNSGSISNCARGYRKTYKGFIWRYDPLDSDI
jgi:group I intron endonuclease